MATSGPRPEDLPADARRRLAALTRSEALPAAYAAMAARHYWPLAQWLWQRIAASPAPYLLGINGAQGSGKSTLARLLHSWSEGAGLATVSLSIDDLYLPRPLRLDLAQRVHPLLATRGVPGTHDLPLALDLLQCLRRATPDTFTAIPRFDKARDDRAPEAQWPRHRGPVQLIILEGWCVGATAQDDAALGTPCNRLERDADGDGRWRHYVNRCLHRDYPALFRQLDALVMLRVPDMACVQRWRREAEDKLAGNLQGSVRDRHTEGGQASPARAEKGSQANAHPGLMDATALEWFIMHYERLTLHQLETLPERADWVFQLNPAHGIDSVRGPS